MNTRLRFALLLILGAFLPTFSAAAQQVTHAGGRGPRMDHTASAMRDAPGGSSAPASVQARTNSVGRPVALMAVGGAAIVLGSLIGGDVGTLFSIGGAIALLYGLYLYLR